MKLLVLYCVGFGIATGLLGLASAQDATENSSLTPAVSESGSASSTDSPTPAVSESGSAPSADSPTTAVSESGSAPPADSITVSTSGETPPSAAASGTTPAASNSESESATVPPTSGPTSSSVVAAVAPTEPGTTPAPSSVNPPATTVSSDSSVTTNARMSPTVEVVDQPASSISPTGATSSATEISNSPTQQEITTATATGTSTASPSPPTDVCGMAGSILSWPLSLENCIIQCSDRLNFNGTQCISECVSSSAVSSFDSNSPCHPDQYVVKVRNPTDSSCDAALPIEQWILFTDPQDSCLEVPIITADNRCFKPGACGSKFPYYLTGSLPSENQEATLTGCTVDTLTSTDEYGCCEEKIEVTVHNCGGSMLLYKLAKSVKATACGRFCTAPPGEPGSALDFVLNDSQVHISLDDLSAKEKEGGLVAIYFTVDDSTLFEQSYLSGEFESKMKTKIIEAVNDDGNSARRKRSTGGDAKSVEILEGYPQYSEDKKQVIYVIVVLNSEAKVMCGKVIKKAIDEHLKGEDLTGSSGMKFSGAGELPPELSKFLALPVETAGPKGGEDRLWIAIIIIIGVTAFIFAVCILAALCYTVSKRRNSRSFNVNQKQVLVGDDQDEAHYSPMKGHDNLAMESEADSNQNSKANNTLDDEKSLEPVTAENTV